VLTALEMLTSKSYMMAIDCSFFHEAMGVAGDDQVLVSWHDARRRGGHRWR
jgi:hypothetical protein